MSTNILFFWYRWFKGIKRNTGSKVALLGWLKAWRYPRSLEMLGERIGDITG